MAGNSCGVKIMAGSRLAAKRAALERKGSGRTAFDRVQHCRHFPSTEFLELHCMRASLLR